MTDEKIIGLAEEIFEEAVAIRRELHRFPELGRQEFNTTKFIISHLEKWGIEYYTPLETGAVAVIRGREKGRTVALRADIDALPLKEKTDVPFKSENEGVMHACGHDLHTAALLVTARLIKENADRLKGEVRLIFQPDEEGDGGAERLTQKGVMDGVDEVYGIHVTPELAFDTVAVRYGSFYAASDIIEIDVIGKGGHGAQPHKNIDAILVASHIVVALQSIISRNVNPVDSAVLTVGTINGGIFRNTVSGRCELTGIVRSFGREKRDYLTQRVVKTAEGVAAAYGARAEVRIIESYPGIFNPNEPTDYVRGCAESLFGKEKVVVLENPGMVSEDFGYYQQRARGSFYHIGCGSENVLHSELFCPDERVLKTMVAMHLKTVFG